MHINKLNSSFIYIYLRKSFKQNDGDFQSVDLKQASKQVLCKLTLNKNRNERLFEWNRGKCLGREISIGGIEQSGTWMH